MIHRIASLLIKSAEKRIGVSLDYTHKIAQTSFPLLMRYNRIFGFLEPNKSVPPEAYHAARIRGALAADCGTCVEAEVNLAGKAGLAADTIDALLAGNFERLDASVQAVVSLADAVVRDRIDHAEARDRVQSYFGDAGLIELSFAMNGAALLPGIKRAMGYATTCDLSVLRRIKSGGA